MKKIFPVFLSLAFFSFQHHAFSSAEGDSTITRPIRFNVSCIGSYDASNTSPRKFLYDADGYARLQAWSHCNADSFPLIDFNTYNLLLVHYTYSGCTRNVDKSMQCTIDTTHKKLLLHVIVHQQGNCRSFYRSRELFLIPTIPTDYSIEVTTPDPRGSFIIPSQY